MNELSPSIECKRFLLDTEDEVLYVIRYRLGKVVYFYDNAYETEPWESGLQVSSVKEFEEKFKIKL